MLLFCAKEPVFFHKLLRIFYLASIAKHAQYPNICVLLYDITIVSVYKQTALNFKIALLYIFKQSN